MDRVSQVQGKLPSKNGEIAVEKNWAKENGIQIGDKIKFRHDDEGSSYFLSTLLDGDYYNLSDSDYKECGMKSLNADTFVVTALCESPAYASVFPMSYGASPTTSTQINCLMFVDESSFDSRAHTGYDSVFLSIGKLRKYGTYSDDYKEDSNAYKNIIEKEANKIADEKCNRIQQAKDDCINDMQVQLNNASASISSAERKINSSKHKLNKIKNFVNKVREKGKNYIHSNTNLTNVNSANPSIDRNETLNRIEEYKKTYQRKRNELRSAERKLSNAKAEYNNAVSNFYNLQDALDKIKDYKSTVLVREGNAAVSMSSIAADMFEKIRYNMASLFLIIGLLVCYSAISRLIFNHSTLIGTKRALGFSRREISRTYLLYAGFSAFLGAVTGLILARYVVEGVFLKVLQQSYIYSEIKYFFSWSEAIFLICEQVLATMIIAYIACRRVLKSSTVDLLSGQSTTVTKVRWYQKLKAWERISVFKKISINNLLNDKKRIFAMLIGVAGCTALIVCAVSFNDTIVNSFIRHYDKVQNYDSIVYYDSNKGEGGEEIQEILDKNKSDYAPVYTTIGSIKTPDKKSTATVLLVFKDKDTKGMLNLYSMDGKKHKLGDKVWINCAYTDYYKIDNNEKVKFIDSETQERNLKIGGSYEYYLQRCQFVMSASTYKKNFGKDPKYNAYIFKSNGNYDALIKKFKNKDSYILSDDFYTSSRESFEAIAIVSETIVQVYLVLAFIMALLIILNLLIMFVQEKKEELITLMINGYSVKKVKKYISLDTIILTALGIILGIIGGILLGKWNVNCIMSHTTYFIKDVDIRACGIGAIVAIVFTAIMSTISFRKVRKFKLSDLNKA